MSPERPLQDKSGPHKLLARYVLDILVAGGGLLKGMHGMLSGVSE